MQRSSAADGETRITRARIHLALRQPFLASALMRLPIIRTGVASGVPTMATDGFHIFYNPAWVAGLSDPELRGVIAHELLHVVFAHAARRGVRDPELWNIACDHAVNLLLYDQGFSLPAGGALDSQYIGMSAEAIYAKLRTSQDDLDPLSHNADGGKDQQSGVLADPGLDLLDPDDPRVRPFRPSDGPDREQVEDIVEDLRQDCKSVLQGNARAWFSEECERAKAATIDWQALLRAWLYDRLRCDWSTWPPNRKHIHRGLILPSVGSPSPGHLVFAVDTSGSMRTDMIASIYGEIAAFRETFSCRLTVLQADTQIRSVESYDAEDGATVPERFSVKGRGGTDFRAVFAWVAQAVGEDGGAVTAIVFATDGYGTFPNVAPPIPVIWLRMPSGLEDRRFPFGLVISLPEARPHDHVQY